MAWSLPKATARGMKYLPREAAFGKLKAMVAGARQVRRELEGSGVAPGTGVNS